MRTAICHMTVIVVTRVVTETAFVWVIVLQDGMDLDVVTSVHLDAPTVHPMTTYLVELVSPILTGMLHTDVSVTTGTPDMIAPIPLLDTLQQRYTHQPMIACIAIPYALEGVQDQLVATAIVAFHTLHWIRTDLVYVTLTGVVMIVA
jgi:hypothetical protein